MKKGLVTFLCLIITSHLSFAQVENLDLRTEIKEQSSENISILTPSVSNQSDVYRSLRYVFTINVFGPDHKSLKQSLEEFVKSKDASEQTLKDFLNTKDSLDNVSKETFEQRFTLGPYESKDLYRINIDKGIDNKIIVLLIIYDDDDTIVGKSRLILQDKEKLEDKVATEEDIGRRVGISGLVVDETKTNLGRKFYDRFYFYYNFNKVKGDLVVKIEEIFTFRRTTKIMVKIKGETIAEFFAQNNDEYIEDMAKLTVQRVFRYFTQRKKQKLYLSQN